MLSTLLGRIANILDKAFLFAYFLPVLIFSALVAASSIWMVGPDAVFGWFEGCSSLQHVALGLVLTLLIVVLAYVLSALRTATARLWTGQNRWRPLRLLYAPLETLRRWEYMRERRHTLQESQWTDLLRGFYSGADANWDQAPAVSVPSNIAASLRYSIRRMNEGWSLADAQTVVNDSLPLFAGHNDEIRVTIYQELKQKLEDIEDAKQAELKFRRVHVDRCFGSLTTIRATQLGNIVEAYNDYSARRYRIEGEVFWSRLIQVVPADFAARMEDQRVMLEFSLTGATLSVTFATLCALGGPWLWWSVRYWAALAATGGIAAYLMYRLAVTAAVQYGDFVRSAYDLFRLDLLKALSLPRPGNVEEERALWESVSGLVVYGHATAIPLRAEGEPPPPLQGRSSTTPAGPGAAAPADKRAEAKTGGV